MHMNDIYIKNYVQVSKLRESFEIISHQIGEDDVKLQTFIRKNPYNDTAWSGGVSPGCLEQWACMYRKLQAIYLLAWTFTQKLCNQ